jgi:glycosyltransferase involved in cell wall biosynthesis
MNGGTLATTSVKDLGGEKAAAAKLYTIAHTECSTGWGGQEIRVFSEMVAMRARGHQLLLCAPPDSAIFRRCTEAAFEVFPLADGKGRFPLTVLRLSAFFRRKGVQVVNLHSSRDGWLGGLAARMAGVPLIIRSRHIEVDYPSRFMSRIAFGRLPHHVITTSQQISRRLIEELGLSPAQVDCIPTGIDLNRFAPSVRGTVHEQLGLTPDVPLVGMVSVFRSWKGHTVLVEAAREIIRGCPQAHCVIAGEGTAVRAAVEDAIRVAGLERFFTILGYREDVPQVLASLTVLVLPSTAHEGIPQIILQAQAMSVAVIGTTVGGIPEVVRDGETGLLVPPRDPAALAAGVIRLLGDPQLRARLGSQARERIVRENSLVRMCEKLEEVYRRHLQTH